MAFYDIDPTIPNIAGIHVPGFDGNPGLLTPQKSGNLLASKAASLRRKAHLSQHEIAELWIYEGGPNEKADEYSAIMMAESGGNARSDSNPCCKGLCQLNVEVGVASRKCAMNAGCATKHSIGQSNNGTDWSPWESFTNGSYKKYLGKSGVHGSETTTTLGSAADSVGVPGIGDVVKFVARLFEPSFWLRVGKGLMGFLLLLFGALTLMKVLIGVDVPTGPAGFLRNQVATAAGK